MIFKNIIIASPLLFSYFSNEANHSKYCRKSHLQEILILGDSCFLPAFDLALHFPQPASQTRKLLIAIIWSELVDPMCDKIIHIGSSSIPLLFYCSVFGLFEIGYHFQLSSYIHQSTSCLLDPLQLNAVTQS